MALALAQIYRDLTADHDKQRGMLKDLGQLRGDTKTRKSLFENFRLELAKANPPGGDERE